MNRITLMSVMAALALIMAPGFAAQAAGPDTSPDVNVNASSTDIETLDTEVEDMDVSEVEDMDVSEVEDVDVGDVADGAEHGD